MIKIIIMAIMIMVIYGQIAAVITERVQEMYSDGPTAAVAAAVEDGRWSKFVNAVESKK